MKRILNNKLPKFAQILGILNNTFKPTVIAKFSRIKIQWLCPFFYMETKFVPLGKRIKHD
jgi:hypothetical protein